MLFTTPTEWAALGITLIAGWLFGLASSSGGKKWKRALEEEEVSNAGLQHEWETALRDANDRIKQLEGERDAALARAESTAPAKPASTDEGGSAVGSLAAAAGVGAVAATLLHRDKDELDAGDAEPVPAASEKNWIPEGPPPPPLAMGAPEPPASPTPQPIAGEAEAAASDSAPAPAPVQEEVSDASGDRPFPQDASAPAEAPTEAGTGDAAPRASDPAPAPVAQSEARPAHEWLPSHVRAEGEVEPQS
ncbi:hypothetical protein [Sphingomonas sp.]|uniref:hypothetical protein n=1 Tax=Sphingomonas sp. TaxID=28214 RepID=UPI001EC64BCC|nr:hypothetical protein [Sphingomonas sp.]MBX3593129.1 hypothetical protein [Sphingomonas sp.]